MESKAGKEQGGFSSGDNVNRVVKVQNLQSSITATDEAGVNRKGREESAKGATESQDSCGIPARLSGN
jgi:hypothetical protein